MRIVVLDIAASSGGALSILKDFYSFVSCNDDRNEWFFLLSDEYVCDKDNIQVHVNKTVKKNWLNRIWFDIYRGKRYINSLNPDIVLSLQNTIPLGISAKKYLYLHQTIPFQKQKKFSFFKTEERIYAIYQYAIGAIIKRSVKRADMIFVQTEWLKSELLKICKKTIKVCTPTIEMLSFEKKAFKSNYFIYPAAPIIYKNHKVIRRACEILVRKGIQDFKVEFTYEGMEDNRIFCIGNIERWRLFQKYTEGTLLFPSYIESFGYPLKEARTQNTIILVADCEYAHEILDGYQNAYFFPYDDAEKLASLMEKIITKEIVKSDDYYCEQKGMDGWNILLESINLEL